MKSSRKPKISKTASVLKLEDPLSRIELPVSVGRQTAKNTNYKAANKALRLLLLVESWHAHAERLILLSKKVSPRKSRAVKAYPKRTPIKKHHEPDGTLPKLSPAIRSTNLK